MSDIGKIIQEYRIAYNLSYRELAAKIGRDDVTHATLRNYVNGNAPKSGATYKAVCKFFDSLPQAQEPSVRYQKTDNGQLTDKDQLIERLTDKTQNQTGHINDLREFVDFLKQQLSEKEAQIIKLNDKIAELQDKLLEADVARQKRKA